MADTQTPPQTRTGITDAGYLTDSWYLAAPSSELKKGQQHRIMMLGEPVVVGRTPANGPCNAPIMAGASARTASAS